MDKTSATPRLRRRQMLQIGLGAAGGLALPALAAPALADDAPLGTWPAGASGSSVFVGVTSPLTGPYSADGKDHVLGYKHAFDEINAGGATPKAWGLKGKGVMGKAIRYGIADSELKPNVAVQAQTQFIQRDKAIMITGCVSSATAVALEELAQREHVLNMVGASGANATTGHDCQRYGFRSQPSAYMACKALAPIAAQHYGRGKKVAYLVPDYNYGHSVFNAFSEFTKPYGWTTATQQVVPLSMTDYSSALLNIANSGADIFVNIEFSAAAVNAAKQAAQFGIFKKMQMIVPNISAFQAQDTGAELFQGVFGTMDFWWTLEDKFPLAKAFVSGFEAKYKRPPGWAAHVGYLQTYIWALAVERAGSFYPPAVIKTLEASKANPFDSTLGKVWYRAADHQLIRPVPVVVAKAPKAMKNKNDYFTVVDLVAGEQAISPPGLLGCKLGPYT
ncbi:MAG: ABC transporter substrate-binding protein [Rhodospirillales bacterium]|nr:ABC transporter substrate-binding protein [Rhodospirillales bacterium]